MGSFTSITYSGDISGQLVRLVFNNGVYKGFVDTTSTTSGYVTAGGNTFATAADLTKFNANIAFTNYVRSDATVSTIKTTGSGLFSGSGTSLTGNGSGDVLFGGDPRITHRITFTSGATNNHIGVSAGTGVSHMDQVIITDASGTTMDCYFGRFSDGFTTGVTNSIEVLALGSTGNATGRTGFVGLTGPFTFETPNGSTSSAPLDQITILKNNNSFREQMFEQIGISLDGGTFDTVTYGVADNKSAVFFRGVYELSELATISTMLQANNLGSASEQLGTYHLPLVGISSGTSNYVGITFNAITGGTYPTSGSTSNNSEFDNAIGNLFKARTDVINTLNTTLRTFDGFGSIREMTSTKF